MEHLIDWVLRQNVELAILICLILVVRFAFKKALTPKAIHLLWLIVLIKSVTYLNVPFVSSKPSEVKSEVSNISSKTIFTQEKNNKSEMQPISSNQNEKPLIENINRITPINEQIVKTETTPSFFESISNYLTADKIKTFLLWFYLFTLAALIVHLVISLIKVQGLKVGGIQNDLLTKKLHALKTKLKINSRIEIYESNKIPSPTLIGVYSFIILIPTNILGKISNDNLEDIITHELMHIKRKDTLVNLIFRFVACLYFYNPFIWVAYFTMKKDMESACDQDVLIKSDFKNNISYAESLLLITKLCKQNGQVNHHAMMFIHKNTFRRIEMITSLKKTGVLSKVAFMTMIVFSLIVFVPSYRAISEERKSVKDIDNTIISIEEGDFVGSLEVFLQKQFKKTLGVKNIFFNYQGDVSPSIVPFGGFKGTFKQFKENTLKEVGVKIYYYHENLYFTNHDENVFLAEFAKIKSFKDTSQTCLGLLNKKIPSITLKNSDLRNALGCIAQEVGFEIDLITMCGYEQLAAQQTVMLEIKVLDENKFPKTVHEITYTDITAWDLLMSLSLNANFLFTFEVKDNKVYLNEETSFNKEVKKMLQQNTSLDKKDYKFNELILALKQKAPKLSVFVPEKQYSSSRANDDAPIKLASYQGTLESILKDGLEEIKMEYLIERGQLVIISKKFNEELAQDNEICKQVYLSANTKTDKKLVDINKLLNEKVTFNYDGITFSEGLNQLGNLTGIKFVFESGTLKDNEKEPLTLAVRDLPVKHALILMLSAFQLKFEHYEDNVLLIQYPNENIKKRPIFEVPSTISELIKLVPATINLKLSKDEKYYVVKTHNDINLYFLNVAKIIINDKIIQPTEIIAVTNNLVLIKLKKSEIANDTECKVLFIDNSYPDSGIEMKE